ncbi:integumentary mucin C.1 [Drosophila sulfurigaster albostrigata]|uniref:integumentary mucin C.1 n=1 Tax=Drosophila sulfurigaster albostrigata TaxID=89887 RepID=UPI002D2188D2|nr:integumentary mucin C.1 [Drosophila sulfurigaster albostrigata]
MMSYKTNATCCGGNNKCLNNMQLTTLTGNMLALMLLFTVVATHTTTTTRAPPELITISPPHWPICRLPPVCVARSPRVCGRTSDGMCRRFANICELLETNRSEPLGSRTWRHAPAKDCRRVREIGAQHEYWCYEDCPSAAVNCPRTSADAEICVRSRNQQVCKVVANRCQLLNNNCFSRPRHNWEQTDKGRCDRMQLGDKPHRCRALPQIVVTPATTTESTTTTSTTSTTTTTTTTTTTQRPTTSEPPKDNRTTTVRS